MGRSYHPVRIFPFGPFVCMDFFFIYLYCGSNKVVKLMRPKRCYLKPEITANIASLQPNVAVCKVRSFSSCNLDRVVEPVAS
jgi:hypothetical protein